jgi:hypothetical protein
VSVFLALFRDAWRRARDRKSVAVLRAIGLLIALFCASIEFGAPVPAVSLGQHLQDFEIGWSRQLRGGGSRIDIGSNPLRTPLRVAARAPAAEDDLPLGLANVAVADVEIPDLPDFDRLARTWRALNAARPAPPAPVDVDGAPLSVRERGEFIAGMLRGHGWETVVTRPRGDDGARFLVAAATDHLADLEGTWTLSLLFRAVRREMTFSSPAEWVVTIELIISNLFVGFVGMLVFLAAFGGAVPDLLQKGSLDLVLARPVGRARVLLCTYAGAVLTMAIVCAVIYAACALALGFRSGHHSFAFVACSLTAAAVFAMLYPVAMLVGLLTRNATLAVLASVATWGVSKSVEAMRVAPWFLQIKAPSWKRALDAVHWIAPKTSEMGALDLTLLGRSQLSPLAYERVRQLQSDLLVDLDWRFVGGSSALFAAAFLALTIAIFRARDV